MRKDGTTDLSTPAAVHAEWIAAVAAGDAERLRPLLAPDYEVWAHGAPPLSGPDAAVAAMRGAMARYHIVQHFECVESIVAGEWAFERGIEHITVMPRAGGPATTKSQRAVLILHRSPDGQWRYARGVTNGLPADESPELSRGFGETA